MGRRFPKIETDDLVDQIEDEYGSLGLVIQRGDEVSTRFDLRRPMGLLSLDVATGGGLPAGGMSQIDGPDGSGKNLFLNNYFARTQSIYGEDFRAFMLCLEYPFDKKWALQCGFRVPMSAYEIEVEQRSRAKENLEPLTNEEIAISREAPGKFYVLRGDEAEHILDASVEMIRSNSFQMGAVDSWDAMLTTAENEADLDQDARIARPATVQTQWMKKIQGALMPKKRCPNPDCYGLNLEKKRQSHRVVFHCKDCGWTTPTKVTKKNPWLRPVLEENESTIVGIRQVRANMRKASMFARDWKTGGAHALKHGKLIDILVRPGKRLERSKKRIGKEIVWELTKGKAGAHEGPSGVVNYIWRPPTLDLQADIYGYCMEHNVIERVGAKYIFEDDEGLMEWKKKDEVSDAVGDDPELTTRLYVKALIMAGLSHVRHI